MSYMPNAGPPIGSITSWTSMSLPKDWKVCNGDILLTADYPALYGVITDTYHDYGTGSPVAGYFTLPNLSDKFVFGAWNAALASANAASTHTHALDTGVAQINMASTPANYLFARNVAATSWAPTHTTGISVGARVSHTTAKTEGVGLQGSTGSASHMPPYLALYFIIRAK